MTRGSITLESFDDEMTGPTLMLSADYQRGLKDGVAQAEGATTTQHARALSEISATLGDMAFGYAEARSELLNQIRPVLAQIAEAILPTLAQETFAAHLVETLDNAFKDVTDQAVEVAVAPDIMAVLGDIEPTFNAVSDPTLSLGQARLRRDDKHILIDLPALVTALQAALQGLEATQRTQTYG